MALGGAKLMWKYVKSLEYPVNIKKKDIRMAKYLVTQYGGANGELAAAFRYLICLTIKEKPYLPTLEPKN